MKNLTWQNPEQLFVAQELINKVKSKCCGIKAIYKCTYSRQKSLQLYRLKLGIFQTNSSSLANTAKYDILGDFELKIWKSMS